MLFNDLYIGVPPGTMYPDLTEIIRLRSRLDEKTVELDSQIGVQLTSDLNKRIRLNARIYS